MISTVKGAASTSVVESLDPRARLGALLDPGSMRSLHDVDDSGVTAVRGTVLTAPVIAYCTDPTSMGGAMGIDGCRHIVAAIETAMRDRCPVIGLWHSGGARLSEGVQALDAVATVFAAMVRASGRVPQISVVLGPAAGGAAYGPALTDVVIMPPAGRIFVTGPDVVQSVTGERIDMEGLGGADAHGTRSGVVHVLAESEHDAYRRARGITASLAAPGAFDLRAVHEKKPDLRALLPAQSNRAYDIKPIIRGILDEEETFHEIQAGWAPNIVVGLGRLAGRSIGVIANNPIRKGGCLDSLAAEKASRFVRLCDSFGTPLMVLVDVPGYLPGVDQEWGGVVRRGAKLLHAFAEAVVPRVTVVLRKSYGGAWIAMNCRALGATAVFAWPEAEIAIMGAKAAVGILHRKKLAATIDKHEREALESQLVAEYESHADNLTHALSTGLVNKTIEPSDTPRAVAHALASAPAGRGQHNNIPL